MSDLAGGPSNEGSNGGARRPGSDYDFVTHDLDRAVRPGRGDSSAGESGSAEHPGLPGASSLYCKQWQGFRDPEELTYGRYVMLQDEAETVVLGVLAHYDSVAHDSCLDPEWLDTLGVLFAPLRYPLYGLQQVESFLGLVAPTSNVVNAAAFATTDLMRATSVVAQRTRQLQMRHPARSFAGRDRSTWEEMPAWQPARRAVEAAMATSDFGEALTAANLMLWPALNSVLFRSFGQVARANGDDLTWLLLTTLANDAERNLRWSKALARYAVQQWPANEAIFQGWVDRWSRRVIHTVEPLAAAIADLPRAMSAGDVTQAAAEAVGEAVASTRAAG